MNNSIKARINCKIVYLTETAHTASEAHGRFNVEEITLRYWSFAYRRHKWSPTCMEGAPHVIKSGSPNSSFPLPPSVPPLPTPPSCYFSSLYGER